MNLSIEVEKALKRQTDLAKQLSVQYYIILISFDLSKFNVFFNKTSFFTLLLTQRMESISQKVLF